MGSKISFGTPASGIGESKFKSQLHCQIQPLANVYAGNNDDGSSTWVSIFHVGDIDWFPGSWLGVPQS